MPFTIVRNDITNMQVDAIVNTANPRPVIGSGCDAGIHKKAGPQLLAARKQIGNIGVGESAATPAFDLDAKYVFHTVGPVWQDGQHGEAILLQQCYESALQLAIAHRCESIAFPLLATGNYGFPKDLALQIALKVFSSFLLQHEMQIYLVVFNREAFALSEKLFRSVESYIDEHYIETKLNDEYCVSDDREREHERRMRIRYAKALRAQKRGDDCMASLCEGMAAPSAPPVCASPQPPSLEELLENTDAGFSETLLKLIDKTGLKDSEVYKKANVDRKLFSKIRNNPDYKPSKLTAVSFALALELDLQGTLDLIGRAGYTLSRCDKSDIILEHFIVNGNYNIFEIDAVLFRYDLQPIHGE